MVKKILKFGQRSLWTPTRKYFSVFSYFLKKDLLKTKNFSSNLSLFKTISLCFETEKEKCIFLLTGDKKRQNSRYILSFVKKNGGCKCTPGIPNLMGHVLYKSNQVMIAGKVYICVRRLYNTRFYLDKHLLDLINQL